MKELDSDYLTIGWVRLDLGISFFAVTELSPKDLQKSQNPPRALQEKIQLKQFWQISECSGKQDILLDEYTGLRVLLLTDLKEVSFHI